MNLPLPFYLLGPTGVGKSELAVALAERGNAEIIGADAFQIYRGLEVLTAQPGASLRARVPHYLIGEIPLTQSWDVAQWLRAAQRRLHDIQSRGKRPLIVGGSGLYVRALTHGLAELPPASAELRGELSAQPLEQLQEKLRALDPEAAGLLDLRNSRRVVRALEVCILTGRPFSESRREWERVPADLHGVILTRERDELHRRINARAEAMFAAGVVEEVRSVTDIGPTAAQALGWRAIQAHLAGKQTRAGCIAEIQLATRQYAKRQMTWFRRERAFRTEALAGANASAALLDTLTRELQQLR